MPDNNDMTAGVPVMNNDNPTTMSAVPPIDDGAISDSIEGQNDNAVMPMDIAKRIMDSKNVLVALSLNPSVDEMAAAIGLTLYLDKLGKRATAIYSGETPNALEFLKPEETFEKTVDSLQDFVIALNKDKADHLRYKLDGEFVKIYITPYKSKIVEGDLNFSYGDFNVDLVLALDVANGVDLDAALREHGRIMHDATIINITNGDAGKLAELEWNDRNASSVSEMIAKMIYEAQGLLTNDKGEVGVGKDEATAFLTGIVAATNRFSNAETKPETMRLASRLMESGANQQLISKNITPEMGDRLMRRDEARAKTQPGDSLEDKAENSVTTELNVKHPEEQATESNQSQIMDDDAVTKKSDTSVKSGSVLAKNGDSASEAEDMMREANFELSLEDKKKDEPIAFQNDVAAEEPSLPPLPMPPLDFDDKNDETLEDFIKKAEASTSSVSTQGNSGMEEGVTPSVQPLGSTDGGASFMDSSQNIEESLPQVQPIVPATPVEEPKPIPLGQQPAMQDQVYHPQAADPGAFKIPGL